MELIDKAAVVAEIEKLDNFWHLSKGDSGQAFVENLLSFLDTLEVKEVDLEKEIELIKGDYEQVDVAWNNDFDFIAKHFFELGLSVSNKAMKGE